MRPVPMMAARSALGHWWVGPPARECSSASAPCPFVGISSKPARPGCGTGTSLCGFGHPARTARFLLRADSALMRCLHVIDALRPSPITAALAALLGTRLRATGEGDVHDVLAFSGGAADEALRARARRLFVAGAGIDVAAVVHARAYDVIHAVDAASAHRIAPLILGSSATPVRLQRPRPVAAASARPSAAPPTTAWPRRPISPSSTRPPTPGDTRGDLGSPPGADRSRRGRGWCRPTAARSRSRRSRRARRRCCASGWRAWPGRRPHERARHDRRLPLRSLSRDRRRPLRDAGRAADRNRATPAARLWEVYDRHFGALHRRRPRSRRSPASSAPTCPSASRASRPARRSSSPAAAPASMPSPPICARVRARVIVDHRSGRRRRAAASRTHAGSRARRARARRPRGRAGRRIARARQPRRAAHRTVGADRGRSSAAPASAVSPATCRRGACGRRPPWPSPLRGGATRLVTLGLDGTTDADERARTDALLVRARRPLRAPTASRSGRSRAAPAGGRCRGRTSCRPMRPASAALTWHDVGGATLLRAEAERDLLFLAPLLPHAREALALARRARAGETVSSRDLCRAIEMLLVWGADPSIRWALQRALGLTFLPRLWRTGVSMASPQRLWRPLVLALHELVEQADRFESRLTTLAHVAPRDGDLADAAPRADAGARTTPAATHRHRTRQRGRPGVRRAPAPRGRARQPRRADVWRSRDPDRPRPGPRRPLRAAARAAALERPHPAASGTVRRGAERRDRGGDRRLRRDPRRRRSIASAAPRPPGRLPAAHIPRSACWPARPGWSSASRVTVERHDDGSDDAMSWTPEAIEIRLRRGPASITARRSRAAPPSGRPAATSAAPARLPITICGCG